MKGRAPLTLKLSGIHHITGIASDPQQNLDFYAGVLGLRLVKKTVNFDDPSTYHLYYGDETGLPGTIMTFFHWPGARRGRRGTGQVTGTAFSIPPDSISYWSERLKAHEVDFNPPVKRFDDEVISLIDPDGLLIELVSGDSLIRHTPWPGGPAPAERAIRGIHSITIAQEAPEATVAFMEKTLGVELSNESAGRLRFVWEKHPEDGFVDIQIVPKGLRGNISAGTVHHVAWRTPTETEQKVWQNRIIDAGLNVSPVMDRQYFHSIYFREPGGVLFEIATDLPGFGIDESPAQLGKTLALPPWLEADRERLEKSLPPLRDQME
jgi:glyoxalase family protein